MTAHWSIFLDVNLSNDHAGDNGNDRTAYHGKMLSEKPGGKSDGKAEQNAGRILFYDFHGVPLFFEFLVALSFIMRMNSEF